MSSPPAPHCANAPSISERQEADGRVGVVALTLGLVAMWIYDFFGDHGVPGRLENPVVPVLAELATALEQNNSNVGGGTLDQAGESSLVVGLGIATRVTTALLGRVIACTRPAAV